MPQSRDRAIGHCERTVHAAFDLPEHVSPAGAGYVRSRFWICPGTRVKTGRKCDFEQLMPGRVKIDLVEPVTVTIEGAQLRGKLVGVEPELHGFGLAKPCAELSQI